MNRSEQREQGHERRREKDYAGAVAALAPLWAHSEGRDLDDGWALAFSLRKLRRHDEALAVCRDLWRAGRRDKYVTSEYAWAVFDTAIAPAEAPSEEVIAAVDAVERLTAQGGYDKFSPFSKAVLKAGTLFKEQPARALALADRLDPAALDDEPYYRLDGGQRKRFPSELERYWTLRTRALKRLSRWGELLDATDAGLKSAEALGDETRGWLLARRGTALRGIGRPVEALGVFQALAVSKDEWWLQLEMARCKIAAGKDEEAFGSLLRSLMMPGSEMAHRIKAIEQMMELRLRLDDPEGAKAHGFLATAIRREQNWPVPAELAERLMEFGAEAAESSQTLLPRLRERWAEWADDVDPPETGVATRLLGDPPHSGFIARDGDQFKLYFRFSDIQGPSSLAVGDAVAFRSKRGFDKKRNEESWIAVEVKPVPPDPRGRAAN